MQITLPPLRLCLATVALAALAACSSKADRITSSLTKGEQYVRVADWDKANLEVRNVLQMDPKSARAYVISAQIAEGSQDIQRAFNSYRKAVELDPADLQAQVGVARMYLLANDVPAAEKSIAEVLAKDAANAGARNLQAALRAKQGDTAGAIAEVRAVIAGKKTAPVESSLLLAGLLAKQGDSVGALEVVEGALKAEPDNLAILMIAAQLAGDPSASPLVAAKAVGFYKQATDRATRNSDLWAAWAMHHVRHRETGRAEEVLRASVKAQPTDEKRLFALIDFLRAYKGADAAEKEFVAAIADRPNNHTLRLGLADLYRATDRTEDARRVLLETVKVGKEAPGALSARNQLAALALAAGRVDEAQTLLGEVLKASPRDGTALQMRGRILLAQGKPQEAVADLRAAAKDRPGAPDLVALLAQAHRAAGEPQLTREVLADAVKFKPDDADLHVLLAADMADSKDYAAANAVLDEAIKRAPQNMRPYEAKAQLAIARKDPAAAERALAEFKTRWPDNAVGYTRMGQLYVSQKRMDAALKEYDAAARLAPADPAPFLAGVSILVGEGRFDEATRRAETLARADPKNLMVEQVRGEIAIARKDLAAAEAAYRRLVAAAPNLPNGYVRLASVLVKRNDMAGALAALDDGQKGNPRDRSIPMTRADLLTSQGRHDDAIAQYESLVKAAPDDPVAANNLAYLLTDAKGDPASLQRALELTRRFAQSGNAGYLDSLGWVHYRLGQYDQAVPLLERAVAMSGQSPLLRLHLGLALYKRGDDKRGIELLRQTLDSKLPRRDLEEARQLVARG